MKKEVKAKKQEKITIAKYITDKGFPYHNRNYREAHEEASTSEKKKYPKGYAKLKIAMKHLGKHEMMATNKKSGKIEVEKRFRGYKSELAYHEQKEHEAIKRLGKKKGSK